MSSVAVVFSLEVLMDRHAWGRVPCHPSPIASIIPNPSAKPEELQGAWWGQPGIFCPTGTCPPHAFGSACCRSRHALGGCWGWILELGAGSGTGHGRSCTHQNAPTLEGGILSQENGVYPNHSSQGGAAQPNPPRRHSRIPAPRASLPVVGPDGVQDELHPVLLADALLVVLDHVGQVLDVTCREKA